MLMAYLLTTHRISNTMTAYQLLRNSLNFLGKKMESLMKPCFSGLYGQYDARYDNKADVFACRCFEYLATQPPLVLTRSIYRPHSEWD